MNPEATEALLVAADALEERGDPWCEFIRWFAQRGWAFEFLKWMAADDERLLEIEQDLRRRGLYPGPWPKPATISLSAPVQLSAGPNLHVGEVVAVSPDGRVHAATRATAADPGASIGIGIVSRVDGHEVTLYGSGVLSGSVTVLTEEE